MIEIQIDLHQDDVFKNQVHLCQFRQISIDFELVEVRVAEFGDIQFSDVHWLIFVHHRIPIGSYSMMQRFAIINWCFVGILSESGNE